MRRVVAGVRAVVGGAGGAVTAGAVVAGTAAVVTTGADVAVVAVV